MSTAASDDELWQAFVEAKREMHRCQADFYQNAQDRPEVLKAALASASNWHQGAALDFLTALPEDGPALLPDLVGFSMSHRWALAARQAIDRIPRDRLWPRLGPLIREQLDSADDDGYWRLAGLLADIEAWPLLEQLVQRAQTKDSPEVHEVAEHFTKTYGPMWLLKPPSASANP
jgi:hypothetical protein